MNELQAFLTQSRETNTCVFLKFGATWCGPCKKIAPVFHDLIQQLSVHTKVAVIEVDIDLDSNQEIVKSFNITSVPTFFCFSPDSSKNNQFLGADKVGLEKFVFAHLQPTNV